MNIHLRGSVRLAARPALTRRVSESLMIPLPAPLPTIYSLFETSSAGGTSTSAVALYFNTISFDLSFIMGKQNLKTPELPQ